jgi:hypothetical protein
MGKEEAGGQSHRLSLTGWGRCKEVCGAGRGNLARLVFDGINKSTLRANCRPGRTHKAFCRDFR